MTGTLENKEGSNNLRAEVVILVANQASSGDILAAYIINIDIIVTASILCSQSLKLNCMSLS